MKPTDQLANYRARWLNQPHKDNRGCYKCGRVCLTAGKTKTKQSCFGCALISMIYGKRR